MPIREIVGVIIVVACIVNFVRSMAHMYRKEYPEATGAKLDTLAALILLAIIIGV